MSIKSWPLDIYYKRTMYERVCKLCGNTIIYKNKYNYQKALAADANCKACAGKLNGDANKGRKRSEESREKMRSNSVIHNEKRKTGRDVRCLECGAIFYRSGWQLRTTQKTYCSKKCANIGHSKHALIYPLKELECKHCGQVFKQNKHTQTYCSVTCNSKRNLKTINSKEPKKSKTNPELVFKELLDVNKIEYIFQKPINWKKGWKKWYDFYIPAYNLLIEIDGTYWHGKNIKTGNLNKQQWNTRMNDRLKNIIAKKRGFDLLRIWSDEINTLNLKETLKRYEQATCSD